jgi:hypothetical protein
MGFLLFGAGAGVLMAVELLQARYAQPNHSWDDRASSIIAGARYLVDSPATFLFGVGSNGGATVLFERGAIPLDGLPVHSRLVDIFSVSGRILLENGAIAGAVILLVLVVPIVRAFSHALPWGYGLLALSVWLVVCTLTITYVSAAWLWGFPGVCIGLMVAISEGRDERSADEAMTGERQIGPGRQG